MFFLGAGNPGEADSKGFERPKQSWSSLKGGVGAGASPTKRVPTDHYCVCTALQLPHQSCSSGSSAPVTMTYDIQLPSIQHSAAGISRLGWVTGR